MSVTGSETVPVCSGAVMRTTPLLPPVKSGGYADASCSAVPGSASTRTVATTITTHPPTDKKSDL